MIARLIGRLATHLTRAAHRLGTHTYLSTGCLHHDHAYCQSAAGRAGAKRPAECKTCAAPCICRCHTAARDGGVR